MDKVWRQLVLERILLFIVYDITLMLVFGLAPRLNLDEKGLS